VISFHHFASGVPFLEISENVPLSLTQDVYQTIPIRDLEAEDFSESFGRTSCEGKKRV
jgi:hypothetical protein